MRVTNNNKAMANKREAKQLFLYLQSSFSQAKHENHPRFPDFQAVHLSSLKKALG